jgi:parallel beta-helix repeat protein
MRISVLLISVLVVCALSVSARRVVVTSAADSGTGTLRQVLDSAQSGDTITFDSSVFPPDAPAEISLRAPLPAIRCGRLTIDASSAGVVLDGSHVEEDWAIGLEIRSSENVIRGLQIVNFMPGAGIALLGTAAGNVLGGSRNVGSGLLGQGNLLSGNGVGVLLEGSHSVRNMILGNLIGTSASGTEANGNYTGIYVTSGSSHNTIGPANIIAFNKEEGIQIYNPESLYNTITANSIHDHGVCGILLNDDGNGSIPPTTVTGADSREGILRGSTCPDCVIELFSDRQLEGATYEGRVIASRDGSFSFEREGRFTGPNVTLTTTTPSGSTSGFASAILGMEAALPVQDDSPQTLVVKSSADSGHGTLRWALETARSGDSVVFDRIVFPPHAPATIHLQTTLPPLTQGNISIDASDAGVVLDGTGLPQEFDSTGLDIYSDSNTLRGLQIAGFHGAGVVIAGGAKRNVIGGDRSFGMGPSGQGNVLAENGFGIALWGEGTSQNQIAGNLIGTDATGELTAGNRSSGVYIAEGANHNVIGPMNVIVHNLMDGVTVFHSSSIGNTITQNTIYGNGGGIYIDNADIGLWEGGNCSLAAPAIAAFNWASGALSGTAAPGSTIEIYSGSHHGGQYEGTTVTDAAGSFSFRKDAPFIGVHLACTATDPAGNTSGFSAPLSITIPQAGNTLHGAPIQYMQSSELDDNRMGSMWNGFWQPFDMMTVAERQIIGLGLKRARLTINSLEQVTSGQLVMDVSKPEFDVDPQHDQVFTTVADSGVATTYTLVFWDKENPNVEQVLGGPRFESEDQVLRYLDFTRFIVKHFQDRVNHFEIWNEPNIDVPGQHIAVDNYIELVRRAVPVIREESPEAKIQVGGTSGLYWSDSREYLFSMLGSDIMPLVDAVSWHPFFGESPEHEAEYYYDYPSIVREIRRTAASHGFRGEYMADEATWWAHGQDNDEPWRYTNTQAAKYYARSIVQHLGMAVSICLGGISERPIIFPTIRNLCTVMAGHEAVDMPMEINIDYAGPSAYCAFRYPNGDRMLAIWTDGIAQDEDPGVVATIAFPGLAAGTVTGIDVLHGFEQELISETDAGDTIVRDLLVRDYPILIRLSHVTFGPHYEEAVGDGFHQSGDTDVPG